MVMYPPGDTWQEREATTQEIVRHLEQTVMWQFNRGHLPGDLLDRCVASTHGTIRAVYIETIEILGGGWLRYYFISTDIRGELTDRYVAPWFDEQLSKGCGVHALSGYTEHRWDGSWFLNEQTLHCMVCGSDGT